MCTLVLAAITPLLLSAGCKRSEHAPPASPAPPPAATMNPADMADVTASYTCDEGNRVDIVRDNVARVGLSDGRVVKIELVDGSQPRTFMDNGLTFVVRTADSADLSDESNRTLACKSLARPTPAGGASVSAQGDTT